jgi:hypothetical protein
MATRRQTRLTRAAAAAALAIAAGCQVLIDVDGLEDRHCGPNQKSCPNGCVPKDDPSTGCALLQCAPCAPPHGKATCGPNGQCVLDGCADGWRDCNQSYSDGCETDLAHDPYNCMSCFNVCPTPMNGIAGCSDQVCAIGGCNPGWGDCDGDPKTGCEHPIWTDEECATCKLPCPAGQTCDRGICVDPPAMSLAP